MQRAFYGLFDDPRSWIPVDDLVAMLGFENDAEAVVYLDYFEIPHQTMPNGRKIALIGRVKRSTGDGKYQMAKGQFTGT